jgi:hypothetical protein
MKWNYPISAVLCVSLACLVLLPRLRAQSSSAALSGRQSGQGPVWTEEFDGSSNTDGQVMTLTSTGGYNFNTHFGMVTGIPVYFVRSSTSSGTTTSSNGIGDFFVGLRIAYANPVVNYRMMLTGTVPTGDSSTGLSTGHATYDWTNHFDRGFGRLTPFVDIGLANSIPNTLFFRRQFTSFGHIAHFDAGTDFDVIGPLSVNASLYDIAPWGTQEVFSRVVHSGGPPAGAGNHGRVYEVNQQTVGGTALTRDNGFNLGFDVSLTPAFDLWGGFSRSVALDLNTVSFGIGVNLSSLFRRSGK